MDKQAIREEIWDNLEDSGVARFPFPPHDRIPNFEDAAAAVDRLEETDAWNAAETIKANPDAPQLPVRRAAVICSQCLLRPIKKQPSSLVIITGNGDRPQNWAATVEIHSPGRHCLGGRCCSRG
jgi:5-formyltetrahydrofolate cyclo-ligase